MSISFVVIAATTILLLFSSTASSSHTVAPHHSEDSPRQHAKLATIKKIGPKYRSVCKESGACQSTNRRPARPICRESGLCIPDTPAWTMDRPFGRARYDQSGFQKDTSPVVIPVPTSGIFLGSALLLLGLAMGQRSSKD